MIVASTLVILIGGWLLLRDSGLVKVSTVEVSGVSGQQAAQVRAALDDAARGMTTLNYDRGELLAAVAQYPIVRDVVVERKLPHTLRIRVVPREPVGVIRAGGMRVAVAADGALLRGVSAADLPPIDVTLPPTGVRVADPRAAAGLAVLASAPDALRRRITAVRSGGDGVTAQLRGGPALRFGTADRVASKWIAARQVLRDPLARRATYIDLRIPERPAAGGLTEAQGGAPQVSELAPAPAAAPSTP
ncbi:unannotated protein [freshwater metagenome]|uniref:Unannotated protein n=1 Tax=freshwater metagenome TaxID=449393 RepID=A0A6J7I7I2_9ZZZZ